VVRGSKILQRSSRVHKPGCRPTSPARLKQDRPDLPQLDRGRSAIASRGTTDIVDHSNRCASAATWTQ